MKTQLTAEESAKLIELGVSPERASEICIDFNGAGRYAYVCGEEAQLVRYCVNGHFYVEECGIFTLADILDILPKFIPDATGDFSYALKIQPCNLPGWQVCYYAYSLDKGKGYQSSPELIDALYSLLVWCLEKGYVK